MSEDFLLHESVPPQEVHRPYSFIFSDNEERLSSLSPTSSDKGKFAYVESDNTIWILLDTNPIKWKEVLTGDSGTKPSGPAMGDLQGEYPFPSVVPDSHLHTPGVSIPSYPVSLPPSGPAGGHLKGSYPNPLLNSTGVISGIYNNPTITVDQTGRITSAISKEAGENNKASNLGEGYELYSHKNLETKSLEFRSIVLSEGSGISISSSTEELIISTPDLAKLSGGVFTGPVVTPDLTSNKSSIKVFATPVYTNPGTLQYFLPDARNGMKQIVVLSGSVVIDNISYAEPGMEFTFLLEQKTVPVSSSVFASNYKFAKNKAKTLSQAQFTSDVLKVVVFTSTLYYAELQKDIK